MISSSSQCAFSAAAFLGATQRMKASSATKIAQITQLAANASSRQPLDEVSSSITITGITASVAPRIT
jgi:hypothetical protein